jgi:hypothetical protein
VPWGFWSAVAERSGDTAFRTAGCIQKRRGASLLAAVQNPWLRRKPVTDQSVATNLLPSAEEAMFTQFVISGLVCCTQVLPELVEM